MGVFEKTKITIIRFLSIRTNLTLIHCLLYGIIGYVMGQYLNWGKLALMFIVLLAIQMITRTKAVADGMMFKQMMMDSRVDANEIIKHMKKEMDKVKKDEWN